MLISHFLWFEWLQQQVVDGGRENEDDEEDDVVESVDNDESLDEDVEDEDV